MIENPFRNRIAPPAAIETAERVTSVSRRGFLSAGIGGTSLLGAAALGLSRSSWGDVTAALPQEPRAVDGPPFGAPSALLGLNTPPPALPWVLLPSTCVANTLWPDNGEETARAHRVLATRIGLCFTGPGVFRAGVRTVERHPLGAGSSQVF